MTWFWTYHEITRFLTPVSDENLFNEIKEHDCLRLFYFQNHLQALTGVASLLWACLANFKVVESPPHYAVTISGILIQDDLLKKERKVQINVEKEKKEKDSNIERVLSFSWRSFRWIHGRRVFFVIICEKNKSTQETTNMSMWSIQKRIAHNSKKNSNNNSKYTKQRLKY